MQNGIFSFSLSASVISVFS